MFFHDVILAVYDGIVHSLLRFSEIGRREESILIVRSRLRIPSKNK